jgi:hypothetical protein
VTEAANREKVNSTATLHERSLLSSAVCAADPIMEVHNPRSVLYGHLPTTNVTQKGPDMMQLHALFASVPAWRHCTADKHISKYGAPRE